VVLSGYRLAMTRYRLLSGLTALVAVLATAPAASADDASLFNAYNARQGEVDSASAAYLRARNRAEQTGSRAAYRAIIRADRRINRALTAIKTDLVGQPASSGHGRKARTAAVREVRGWRHANNLEIRGIQAFLRGDRDSSNRWYRRANRTMIRCYRQGRIAVRHFKAVGLKSSLGAISA
jgi:hypothetical protein